MSLDLFPTALSLVQLHDCITIYIQVSSASRLPVESLHKTIGVTALLRTNIQIAQLVLPGRITMDGNGDRKCSTFWLLGGSRFRAMSLKTSSKSLKQPLGTETITHTLKVRRFYTSICTYMYKVYIRVWPCKSFGRFVLQESKQKDFISFTGGTRSNVSQGLA